MKKIHLIIVLIVLTGVGICCLFLLPQPMSDDSEPIKFIHNKLKLPKPKYESNTPIEKALLERRSVREYKDEPLTLSELSQLLWAAQGITEPGKGFRTAPSAGALYPLEVYLVVGNVKGLASGVYKYRPLEHEIAKVRDGDVRNELTAAALGQSWVGEGSIVIVFSAVYERTTRKYGDRGIKYVHMEVGHTAQNVWLQAVSLNLGTVVIGAFKDNEVSSILNIPDKEKPLCIMPVGKI
ncbi:SagB/ThcOx family dehydrogenase [Ignavibacterium sp.]|uniref:SagB/ThcOx family dehydrogenase n=1 Tax=Ignavibacterium sp. TaxID=2651167 RepID=UPI00307E2C9E